MEKEKANKDNTGRIQITKDDKPVKLKKNIWPTKTNKKKGKKYKIQPKQIQKSASNNGQGLEFNEKGNVNTLS